MSEFQYTLLFKKIDLNLLICFTFNLKHIDFMYLGKLPEKYLYINFKYSSVYEQMKNEKTMF